MAVKDAVSSEFKKFIEEEIKDVQERKGTYANDGKTKWYVRKDGPAEVHKHERKQLNKEVKASIGGPSRGMGKIAADTIAVAERAFKIRNMTRRHAYVKKQVQCEQLEAALENLRDSVNTQVTA